MSKRSIALATAILLAATGCTTFQNDEDGYANWRSIDRNRDVETKNLQLVSSIEHSLSVLAGTKNAEMIGGMSKDEMAEREWLYSVIPDGMGMRFTIEQWDGPSGEIIEMLADMSGYKIKTSGRPKRKDRNVSIRAIDQPIIDALRDVAIQAGCDVFVDVISKPKRIIVLDYGIRAKGGCK
jgi:hypothetical protein